MNKTAEQASAPSLDARIERFLLRQRILRFQLWQALLLIIISGALVVFYGMLAVDGGKRDANILARGIHLVSIAPHLAMRAIADATGENNPRLAREQRFKGEGGWRLPAEGTQKGAAVVLSRYDGDERRGVVEIVDLDNGEIIHSWRPDVEAINRLSKIPPEQINLERDFTLARYMEHHPFVLEDGSIVYHGMGSPLVKLDACSRVIWTVDGDFHHSTERDSEGNFWTASAIHPPSIPFVANDFDDDAVTKVSPDGEILFAKSVAQILIDAGFSHIVYSHDEYDQDPIHLNDIQPANFDGPYWKKGDVFLSLRNPSMILLYRPSTNEVVWSKQGPWLMQHDVDILSDHEIAVFNNNTVATPKGGRTVGSNSIVVYDFAADAVREPFTDAFRKHGIHTETNGLFRFFPDGSVMIEEHDYGRLLAIGPDGEVLWSFVNRAPKDGRVFHLGWSRALNADDARELKKNLAAAQCDG